MILQNDVELLNRISMGDEQAFAELFNGYHQQLGEFVQLLVHDLEATKEIVQEVFAKVWMNRESLYKVKKIDAYLFILCRNHTLNHIRQLVAERKRQEAYVREVNIVDMENVQSAETDYHELIEKAVELLPPQQQQVFVFRLQGLKNPEISQRMNLSLESVKKYQHLAVKSIKEFVRVKVFIPLIVLAIHIFF